MDAAVENTLHAPRGYECPFCAVVAGAETGTPRVDDVVAETDRALAFVAARWWPNNRGHVLVVPKAHAENLYTVPEVDLLAMASLVRRAAVVIRTVDRCDGVSTRQHNEPAGGQDVWHIHTHVFPRWAGDDLNRTRALAGWAEEDVRARRARELRGHPDWTAGLASEVSSAP